MVRKILTATLAFCALSGAAWGEQTTNSKFPRIVSLAPSVTETLFAVGAGAQLVGICTFCDFPRAVAHLDRIGSYLAPDPEIIDPTDVIVQVDTIEQIETAMRTVAHEAGRDAQGEALLAGVRGHMAAVRARLDDAPQRRVLLLVGQNPLIAVGSGIFLNELIEQAHGVNLAAGTGQQWPQLSLEFAVASQPEVIIDSSMGSDETDKPQRLGIWRNFPALPAVRNGRLYGRRSDTLLRPGPRLAEGFEELARLIHPECFQ